MITSQELAQSPLFSDLPADVLDQFAALAREVTCPAGKMLFREGNEASHLYLLRTGKINVLVQPTALTEPLTIVSLSTFGQLVGWSGFMPPNYYTASALCQEDSTLLAFDGQRFNDILEENPAVGLIVMRRIAHVISQRLRTIQGNVIKSLYRRDQ